MALTTTPKSRERVQELLALAAALCIAGLIAWPLLDRGWTPHDDGMLGQTAERIRLGQLPHRDFEELYSGALGYWNALAQWMFGTTMMAPRYALFGAWCGWIVMVFGIVKRTTAFWWAAALTVAVAMWTLPVYPSPMPSWYLLFCATAAAAALLKWNDGKDARWLAAAGAAIGVALTIKITALYLLAAALVALTFAAQEPDDKPEPGRKTSAPSVVIIGGSVVLAMMVIRLLRDRTAAPELLHLAAPMVFLVLALSAREVRVARTGGRSWGSLFAPMAWLAAGVALPIVLFALPYLFTGSLSALVRGVFVDPLSRIGGMNYVMRPLDETARGLYVIALAAVELRWGAMRAVKAVAVTAALWFAWRSTQSYIVYQAVWEGARLLLPATVALVAFRAVMRPPDGSAAARQRFAAVTLSAFAALFALNQFPFSATVYFCFVAPLAFLALAQAMPDAAPRLAGTTVLLGTFAVVSLHPGDLNTLGHYPAHVDLTHRLAMPRGGLRVSAGDSALYTDVEALIAVHRSGRAVFAGPGIPEVPFLAGPPYFGHQVFHFIPYSVRDTTDVATLAPPDSASVVIWNLHPAFGERVSPGVKAWYDARFPQAAEGNYPLEVRWR
jgi:hypothetical protein